MKILKQTKKAYTLLETLMYVGITSIVMMLVASTFIALTISKERNRVYSEVDYQGIKIMNVIAQEIRLGHKINTPTQGQFANMLSLESYIPTENPTVFQVIDGSLYMTKGTQPTVKMTNDNVEVTQFGVINTSGIGTPGSIKYYITIKNLKGISLKENLYSQTYEGSASLR